MSALLPASDPAPWVAYFAGLWEARPRRHATPGGLAAAVDANTRQSPALAAIDGALAALAGEPARAALEITMPPQEGKSERVSRRFTEWELDYDPALRVAIISYELDLARRWGLAIRRDIETYGCTKADCTDPGCHGLHIPLRRDRSAAGDWETTAGGGVYCVGIGGPLTGRPADIVIIDDPVKDRAEAESARMRERTWDWWESVAIPRLGTHAKVVLIQTRWHEDDLAGRIAARPGPLKWRRLTIPAIADSPDDPLGRPAGAELVSVRDRPPGYFAGLRAGLSNYVFASVYQQRPTAAEGNFFRRATFRYWRPAPPWPDGRAQIDCEGTMVTLADCWYFHTMDAAASTKTEADWTVVSSWAVTPAGDLILLERARAQAQMQDHFGLAAPALARWGGVLYVEKNFYSTTVTDDASAAGVPVAPLTADKDKVTRATPAAGRVHAGKVWFPAEAPWLDEWCDELATFPKAAHDDQVDTLAYAARVLTGEYVPAAPPPRPGLDPHEQVVAAAHRAATGDGARDLDIFGVPM